MDGLRRLTIITLMLGIPGGGATAQTATSRVPAAAVQGAGSGNIAADADRLYYNGRPAESLAALRAHIVTAPSDTGALWRAARAALAVGWLEPDEPVSIRSYREAEQLAHDAVRADPGSTAAHYILAAALGRRALIAKTPRAAATLASQVHSEAMLLLKLDAQHAGAHSVLGQLHAEAMRKPWAVRVIGLRLGGGVSFKPDWKDAERELRTAAELEPEMIVHRFELARVYHDTKRAALAMPLLEQVLAMPVVHPMDALLQENARRLLGRQR